MNLLGKISLFLCIFLLLTTLGLKAALAGWMPFYNFGFGGALFFFCFAIATNIKFFKGLLKSESLHFLAKSTGLVLMLVLTLFLLNYVVANKNFSKDITVNKIHSLPELTEALIKALPEDLTFYYFHVGNENVRGFESIVRDKLQPYLQANSKVSLKSFNIFQRPDLAKKFKIGDEESSLFVEFQGRIQRVDDLNETEITNALLKLTKPPKKIYFAQSHDERKIDDDTTFGAKGIVQQLGRLHYEIAALDDLSAVPEDAAMLVLMGPRKKISEQSLASLDSYLQKGGSLLIAADPDEEHGINRLIEKYGLKLRDDFIFAKQKLPGFSELMVLTVPNTSTEHEVAQSVRPGENPRMFIASSLELLPEVSKTIRVTPVLDHLPDSVGRADIDIKSKIVSQGKKTAAAVSEGLQGHFFRLAVVGDSDFMTNQAYVHPENFKFAVGLFSFLSKDEDLLRLRIPTPKTTYLILTQTQMNLYFLFFILPMALLFFILALFFKLRRLF